MILANNKITIDKSGQSLSTTKMEISIENEAAIIEIIVGFYKNKVESIIRETVSNSTDSRIESGKLDKPVIVSLIESQGSWIFKVQDFGVGINQDTVDSVLSRFGKSTKTQTNDLLGAYGLGFKSPFCYTNYFTVTGVKDGVEGKWIFRRDENGFTIDCLYNNLLTQEENGSIVEIKLLQNSREEKIWSNAIREQLAYFKDVFIIDEKNPISDNNYSIYELEDCKISELYRGDMMHLCIEDVYYPIDFQYLGIDPIHCPIGLKFSLGDGIEPLPARESYRNTELSRELILDKIKKVATNFVDMYNQNCTNVDTWREGRKLIESKDIILNFQDVKLNIKELKHYSHISVKEVSIKGFDDDHIHHLLKLEFRILRVYSRRYFISERRSKESYGSFNFESSGLLMSSIPTGNLREYLKDEYNNSYIYTCNKDRKLWKSGSINEKEYWYPCLHLHTKPKDQWRKYIQEAMLIMKEAESNLKDFRNFKIPEEWLEKRKKQRQRSGDLLNKQEGEVTIGFIKYKEVGSGFTFKKGTYPIDNLNPNHIVVYSSHEENKEMLENLYEYFRSRKKTHTVAIIGSREALKIKGNSKFKTIGEFMEMKLFREFATSCLADRIIREIEDIDSLSKISSIINWTYLNYKEDIENLIAYSKRTHRVSRELAIEMIEYADKNNLYDIEMMSSINRVREFTDMLGFLRFIRTPDEEKDVKDFRTFLLRNIIYNKKYKNMFDNWELILKKENNEIF